MKFFLALVLATALLGNNAVAGQLEYDLKVEGMKCAYCAYNVSKKLEALDGVVSESVNVDLEQGRVTLQSAMELEDAELAAVLLQAGFNLASVSEVAANAQLQQQRSDLAVVLSVSMMADRVSAGEFDAVLEALGAVAADRSGRVTVVGPGELETAILKPVLAGRSTVIKVDYDRTTGSDQTVAVSVSVNAERAL